MFLLKMMPNLKLKKKIKNKKKGKQPHTKNNAITEVY